eukprot:jgi/Mesen1/1977/ME000147S01071
MRMCGDASLRDVTAVGVLSLLLVYMAQWDFWDLWSASPHGRLEVNVLDSGVGHLKSLQALQARLVKSDLLGAPARGEKVVRSVSQSPLEAGRGGAVGRIASGESMLNEAILSNKDEVSEGGGVKPHPTGGVQSGEGGGGDSSEEEGTVDTSTFQGGQGARASAPHDDEETERSTPGEPALDPLHTPQGAGVGDAAAAAAGGGAALLAQFVEEAVKEEEAARALAEAEEEKRRASPVGKNLEIRATGQRGPKECAQGCSEHGTCNLELGRCDCLSGFAGPDCSEWALPSCHLLAPRGNPEYYHPCLFQTTCACALECERLKLPHSNTCYDERRPNGTVETDMERLFDGPQKVLSLDWHGNELRRQAVTPDRLKKELASPEACANNCTNRGVCIAENKQCVCPYLYGGRDCSQGGYAPLDCYNDCSLRGECIGGVCKCQPGTFGLDCSLSIGPNGTTQLLKRKPFAWTDSVKVPDDVKEIRPLIYVYDLPGEFNTWQFSQGGHIDWPEPVYFLERILNSPNRTPDPDKADFFYIPLLLRNRGLLKLQTWLWAVDYVNATWPFYRRHNGADHMLMLNDDWGACELGHRGRREKSLDSIMLLSLWGHTRNMMFGPDSPCFIQGQDLVIPPRLIPHVYVNSPHLHPQKGEDSARDLLAYFTGSPAFKAQTFGPFKWSFGVRQEMFTLFSDTENTTGIRLTATDLTPWGYLEVMLKTVFCLAPSGWGWGMRTTQVALLGCIPVVIQPNVTQPLEGDLLDWSQFSVMLPKEAVPKLPEILRAVPPEEIERKRAAMREVWQHFTWASWHLNPLESLPPAEQARLAPLLAEQDAVASLMSALYRRLELSGTLTKPKEPYSYNDITAGTVTGGGGGEGAAVHSPLLGGVNREDQPSKGDSPDARKRKLERLRQRIMRRKGIKGPVLSSDEAGSVGLRGVVAAADEAGQTAAASGESSAGNAAAGVETGVPEYMGDMADMPSLVPEPEAPNEEVAKEVAGKVQAYQGPSKCAEGCSLRGTCNEELGRCDCPANLGGPACADNVLSACHLMPREFPAYYSPCHLATSCACALQCERIGLVTPKVCFDERRPDGSLETDVRQLYAAGRQSRLFTDGRGNELLSRRPAPEFYWTKHVTAPQDCPLNCSGRGVCKSDSHNCECPGIFGGSGCEADGWGVPFKCFNKCSGNGECKDGVCKCHPPFYGLDCSLFLNPDGKPAVYQQKPYWWTDAVQAPTPDPDRRPRLYVYEMRVHDVAWLYKHSRHLDWQEPFYFIERALNNEFRVADGKHADFFFVPLIFRWHNERIKHLQSAIAYIEATWPFWNRSNGADHIFLTNDDWGNCEMDLSAKGFGTEELAVPITLSLWSYTKNMWAAPDRPCFVNGKDIALPPKMTPHLYPVVPYWGDADNPAAAAAAVAAADAERDLLLYFKGYPAFDAQVWTSRGKGYRQYMWSFGVRQRMFEIWEGRENETGIVLDRTGLNGALYGGYLEGMARSVFCFSPAGWGWGMRTTQALQAGCIPVIIQPNVTQPLEYDLLDWDTFSVKLTVEDIPTINKILRAIPAEEIARKRAAMRDVWMRFVWTSPQLNPLELQPHRMTDENAQKLAKTDVFASIMEILRLRLERKREQQQQPGQEADAEQQLLAAA